MSPFLLLDIPLAALLIAALMLIDRDVRRRRAVELRLIAPSAIAKPPQPTPAIVPSPEPTPAANRCTAAWFLVQVYPCGKRRIVPGTPLAYGDLCDFLRQMKHVAPQMRLEPIPATRALRREQAARLEGIVVPAASPTPVPLKNPKEAPGDND
ncbi:MAG: hypothetical protein KDA41_18620 [Planctomycetales bacterium]|nr:hypothetical protein [Planctomycetales bacterium]